MPFQNPHTGREAHAVTTVCHVLSQLHALGFSDAKAMKMLRLYFGERLNNCMEPTGVYHYTWFNQIAIQLKYKNPHQMIEDMRSTRLFLIGEGNTSYGCLFFASPLYVTYAKILRFAHNSKVGMHAPVYSHRLDTGVDKAHLTLPGNVLPLGLLQGSFGYDLSREDMSQIQDMEVNLFISEEYLPMRTEKLDTMKYLLCNSEKYGLDHIICNVTPDLATAITQSLIYNEIAKNLKRPDFHFLDLSIKQRYRWVDNLISGRYQIPLLSSCIHRLIEEGQIPPENLPTSQ